MNFHLQNSTTFKNQPGQQAKLLRRESFIGIAVFSELKGTISEIEHPYHLCFQLLQQNLVIAHARESTLSQQSIIIAHTHAKPA